MGNGPDTDLERKLGLFPVTNIVVANMIGSGIFTTSGLLMGALGDPLLILALSFFQRPAESSLAILCVLSGVPVYLYFRRRAATRALP